MLNLYLGSYSDGNFRGYRLSCYVYFVIFFNLYAKAKIRFESFVIWGYQGGENVGWVRNTHNRVHEYMA